MNLDFETMYRFRKYTIEEVAKTFKSELTNFCKSFINNDLMSDLKFFNYQCMFGEIYKPEAIELINESFINLIGDFLGFASTDQMVMTIFTNINNQLEPEEIYKKTTTIDEEEKYSKLLNENLAEAEKKLIEEIKERIHEENIFNS